ncbi:MAG: type II toxin-antitoxin system VapC family toxin [Steroidobacteraceae bacterium]
MDTNVLLDVVEDDQAWADWSQRQLDDLGLRERLCVNAVVYAELSLAFSRIEELEQVLADGDFEVAEIPREALFLAAKAFLRYRRQATGPKVGVLPDFFIGAHAAVTGMSLLTRDAKRYQTYFPTVRLISPD